MKKKESNYIIYSEPTDSNYNIIHWTGSGWERDKIKARKYKNIEDCKTVFDIILNTRILQPFLTHKYEIKYKENK